MSKIKDFLKLLASLIIDPPYHVSPEQIKESPNLVPVEPEKPKGPEPILEAEGIKVGDQFCVVRYINSYPIRNDYPLTGITPGRIVTVDKIVKNTNTYSYYHPRGQYTFVCAGGSAFDSSFLTKNIICRLEDKDKFQKIIDAENNFQVEFKVRKKEGIEDYSVWWRSTNHPNYREWTCIVSPKVDVNSLDSVSFYRDDYPYDSPTYYYHPYYFDSKEDAEEAIKILKTRDPKRLFSFERKWQDV